MLHFALIHVRISLFLNVKLTQWHSRLNRLSSKQKVGDSKSLNKCRLCQFGCYNYWKLCLVYACPGPPIQAVAKPRRETKNAHMAYRDGLVSECVRVVQRSAWYVSEYVGNDGQIRIVRRTYLSTVMKLTALKSVNGLAPAYLYEMFSMVIMATASYSLCLTINLFTLCQAGFVIQLASPPELLTSWDHSNILNGSMDCFKAKLKTIMFNIDDLRLVELCWLYYIFK